VVEDGALWDAHLAGEFAEGNPGYVRDLDLLPSFLRDLSAHTLKEYQTLVALATNSNQPTFVHSTENAAWFAASPG
jgi:hypothetical protein